MKKILAIAITLTAFNAFAADVAKPAPATPAPAATPAPTTPAPVPAAPAKKEEKKK